MADLHTQALPVLPLPTGVVLPSMVVTLALDSPDSRAAAEAALAGDGRLLLVPFVNGTYARVGTVAQVDTAGDLPNGTRALILRGLHRAVLGTGVSGGGDASVLWVQAEPVTEDEPDDRTRELTREFRAVISAFAERRRSRRMPEALAENSEPSAVVDAIVGVWNDLSVEKRLEALETTDVEERLTKVTTWARDALAELELGDKIRTDVAEGMERTQREFLLRQQMAAIRKELGETVGEDAVEEYRAKVADSGMPEAARVAAEREIDRLERMSEQSPEYGWIRTWLDWMIELPWSKRSEDRLDVRAARDVLDADHTGLDEVKDRIIEYL